MGVYLDQTRRWSDRFAGTIGRYSAISDSLKHGQKTRIDTVPRWHEERHELVRKDCAERSKSTFQLLRSLFTGVHEFSGLGTRRGMADVPPAMYC